MKSSVPLALRLIRFAFPLVERWFPSLGARWAIRLFLTPARTGFIPGEVEFLKEVERFDLQSSGRKLAAYRLGKGPEVLCLHGWAGRAAQFRYIARALAANGFTFIGVDAWAHGQSGGKSTHMLEFAECLTSAMAHCKDLRAVVGHSLGAAAICYAATTGVRFPKVISIAAPVIAEEILQSFIGIINGTEKTKASIRTGTMKRVGRVFDDLTMQETFKALDAPILAIHGMDDKDVRHAHLDYLLKLKPGISAVKYPGVGHRRILKDPNAIQDILSFVKG